MNVVYWRMMNGGLGTYMNGSTGLATTGTAPALSPLAAPAPTAAAAPGLTVPHAGYYPGTTYLSTPQATPTAPSPALTNPHSGLLPSHKWVFPDWNMQQLQYMFLPKLPRLKGERVNKSVKCEICNITLNSEVQAKQHYSGKNHLKKMKQMGMALPGEEEGKKVMENYGSKSQDDGSEAQSSTSETATDESTNQNHDDTTSSQPNSRPTSRPTSPEVSLEATEGDKNAESNGDLEDGDSDASSDNLLGKLPRKRKLEIPCSVCDIVFNSEVQADQHFKGVRHAKRTKMAEDDEISDEGSREQVRGQMEGQSDLAEVTWSQQEEGSKVKDGFEGEGHQGVKERICDSIQSAFDMQPREGVCLEQSDVCDS